MDRFMRIKLKDLRNEIVKIIREEKSKWDTEAPLENVKYSKPATDLSVLTIGDLGMVAKYGYKNPTKAAEKYITALTRMKDIREKFGDVSGKEIVESALKSLDGWVGSAATSVKTELKRRVTDAL